MKLFRIHTFAAMLLASLLLPAFAQSPPAAPCPEVRVSKVVPGSGSVMLAVWASKDSFFKHAVWSKKIPATTTTLTVALCGLEATEIAITVYQDLNDNGKLDANFVGIPSEPTGASGAPSRFKAPDWESTRVPVIEGKVIDIRL